MKMHPIHFRNSFEQFICAYFIFYNYLIFYLFDLVMVNQNVKTGPSSENLSLLSFHCDILDKQTNWWLTIWCLTVSILLSHAGGWSEAPEPVWLHWGGHHASRVGRCHQEAMEGFRRPGFFWESCWVPTKRLRRIVSKTLSSDSNTY